MKLVFLYTAVAAIIVFSLMFYTLLQIRDFQNYFEISTQNNVSNLVPGAFSYDLFLQSFPDSYKINNENADDCTAQNSKLCDIRDASSCSSCKNLSSKCEHLNQDMIYYNEDKSQKYTLQKNADENEGYCMALTNVLDRCNVYQSDSVLVEDNLLRLSVICECKNPGYIDKARPDDDCDRVLICDGNIDNINQPLSEINCVCPEGFINDRQADGCPFCKTMLVKDFNYKNEKINRFTNPISIDNFDNMISKNINSDQLSNPCTFCLFTGSKVNGILITDKDGNAQCACQEADCVPVRVSSNYRILKGSWGPDAVLKINYDRIHVYGKFGTDKTNVHQIAVHAPNNAANQNIYKALSLDQKRTLLINLNDHGVTFPCSLRHISKITCFHGFQIYIWGSPALEYVSNESRDPMDKSDIAYTTFTNNQHKIIMEHKTHGKIFWSDDVNPPLYKMDDNDNPFGVQLVARDVFFEKVQGPSKLMFAYVQYVPDSGGDWSNTVANYVSFKDENTWSKWKSALSKTKSLL